MRTINYVLRGTATEIRADFAADAGGGVSVPALPVLVVECQGVGQAQLPIPLDDLERIVGSGSERVEVEITIRPAWPAITPLQAHEAVRRDAPPPRLGDVATWLPMVEREARAAALAATEAAIALLDLASRRAAPAADADGGEFVITDRFGPETNDDPIVISGSVGAPDADGDRTAYPKRF